MEVTIRGLTLNDEEELSGEGVSVVVDRLTIKAMNLDTFIVALCEKLGLDFTKVDIVFTNLKLIPGNELSDNYQIICMADKEEDLCKF